MATSYEFAYAEIDAILDLLEIEYLQKIPQKVRNFFKEEKDKNHKPIIRVDIPLEEQNLQRKTIIILSILNLNYWCDNEEEKKNILKTLSENNEIKKFLKLKKIQEEDKSDEMIEEIYKSFLEKMKGIN